MDINIASKDEHIEMLKLELQGADDYILTLEMDLENSYKDQEDLKRVIKDLEEINQETLEQNHMLWNDLEICSGERSDLILENKELKRTIDIKDQIITTFRIENAKCFHENEKLKEEIKYLKKIIE